MYTFTIDKCEIYFDGKKKKGKEMKKKNKKKRKKKEERGKKICIYADI